MAAGGAGPLPGGEGAWLPAAARGSQAGLQWRPAQRGAARGGEGGGCVRVWFYWRCQHSHCLKPEVL